MKNTFYYRSLIEFKLPRKINLLLVVLGLLIFTQKIAWSQDNYAHANLDRIQLVLKQILLEENEHLQALENYRDSIQKKSINFIHDKFEWANLMRERGTLSPAEYKTMKEYLIFLEKEITSFHHELDSIFTQNEIAIFQYAKQKMDQYLKEQADEKNISIIFNSNGVLFLDDTMEDLTDVILEKFKLIFEQFKKELILLDTYPTLVELKERQKILIDYKEYKKRI